MSQSVVGLHGFYAAGVSWSRVAWRAPAEGSDHILWHRLAAALLPVRPFGTMKCEDVHNAEGKFDADDFRAVLLRPRAGAWGSEGVLRRD